MKHLIIATANKHKVTEIKNKFIKYPQLKIEPMDVLADIPEIEETGSTFSENALIKAATIADICNSFVLADDSGLQIDYLNGEPGIYSARYGNVGTDRERYELVLQKMNSAPQEKRKARFICSMALIIPNEKPFIAEGICEGEIATSPSGIHGFGYDPIFYLPSYGKTMAEIPLEEKNKISHRALALEKIFNHIKNYI